MKQSRHVSLSHLTAVFGLAPSLVHVAPAQQSPASADGPPQFNIIWVDKGLPLGVNAVLTRVKRKFDTLLSADQGNCRIAVAWTALPASSNAQTNIERDNRTFGAVRDWLKLWASKTHQSESSQEQAMYGAFFERRDRPSFFYRHHADKRGDGRRPQVTP